IILYLLRNMTEFVECDRESARYDIENAVCDKEFAPHSHCVSGAFSRFQAVSLELSKSLSGWILID
ncbi:TPA: hypothetical protein ACVO34_004544, partial [Vibrio diabolicus]